MPIQRTEAVILRTIPYGETSKIVTALTKNYGKVTFIAKGARDVRSKYGGSLEPFSHVHMIYYERETRDLQYLSDVTVIHPFLRIRDDLQSTYAALSIAEICQRAVHGVEPSESLFSPLVETLLAIEEKPDQWLRASIVFLVHASDYLGYRLRTECSDCKDILEHRSLFLNVEKGCLVCESCPAGRGAAGEKVSLSHEAAAVLIRMVGSRDRGLRNIVLTPKAARELWSAMLKHLGYHTEDLRGLHAIQCMRV